MRGEEGFEMFAADFLLTFDEEDQIHGHVSLFAQCLPHPEHVREDLAFVVCGAACVNHAIAHDRLKRRRSPLAERVHRLDVVVPVNHHGAPTGDVLIARNDDGMPARRVDLRLQTQRV